MTALTRPEEYFAVVSAGPYYPRFTLTLGRYSGEPSHDQQGSPRGRTRIWTDRTKAEAEANAYAAETGFASVQVYRRWL